MDWRLETGSPRQKVFSWQTSLLCIVGELTLLKAGGGSVAFFLVFVSVLLSAHIVSFSVSDMQDIVNLDLGHPACTVHTRVFCNIILLWLNIHY